MNQIKYAIQYIQIQDECLKPSSCPNDIGAEVESVAALSTFAAPLLSIPSTLRAKNCNFFFYILPEAFPFISNVRLDYEIIYGTELTKLQKSKTFSSAELIIRFNSGEPQNPLNMWKILNVKVFQWMKNESRLLKFSK